VYLVDCTSVDSLGHLRIEIDYYVRKAFMGSEPVTGHMFLKKKANFSVVGLRVSLSPAVIPMYIRG
jgi:hypothetical protein